MRALVTGATGFIGGRVAAKLLERGWDVIALVRSPERAAPLRERGVRLVEGDIAEPATLPGPMQRVNAVFHLAAWYQLGVPDRQGMYRINVKGTENVIAAAERAGVERILYCSSVAVFGAGSTDRISTESTRHPGRFGSAYEETKWQAHERVRALAAEGAPVVSVMPGAVYGPGDESVLGQVLRFYAKGWLFACPFQEAGFSWVHVDDVAEGIVRAYERGPAGGEFILGGDNETIGGLLRRIAPLTGIRPPRWSLSARMMRLATPLGPIAGRVLRTGPRIIQDATASLHGSWFASSLRAQRWLEYRWRTIEEGVPETVEWFKARG